MNTDKFFKILKIILSISVLLWTKGLGGTDLIPKLSLRPSPQPSLRAMAGGKAWFVSPDGDDSQDGSFTKPWKSINHALKQLNPGDTLYLRGGVYFENVYCAIAARPDAPITLRSYPGELAIIDGSLPEFQLNPKNAWVKSLNNKDEFISRQSFKNIRDVVGRFGDSLIGLQTYWYQMDLLSENELWIPDNNIMVKPVYCGPGLWYNKETGRIHCRLVHTKLQLPEKAGHQIIPYRGETDPRLLPLIIAPFAAKAMFIDQAMYIRFQDLIFRGGGYVTIKIDFGVGIEFDNCIIYAGTYGIWAKNTGPFKMINCAVYGMIPPWAFRSENCLYSYSPENYPPFVNQDPPIAKKGAQQKDEPPKRNIARLPTHALLVTEGGYEFETFYYPFNHDWDISYCEFADAHDGVYLSGRNIHFHHNWVDNVQDDAIYISSPTPGISDRVYIYQNLITTCTVAFGAHNRGGPGGDIFIYRNIVDMRRPIQFHRPSPENPEGRIIRGSLPFLVHGAAHLLHQECFYFYHNTFVYPLNRTKTGFAGGTAASREKNTRRAVLNNIFVFYGLGGEYPLPIRVDAKEVGLVLLDGNLHWNLTGKKEPPGDWLKSLRDLPFPETLQTYLPKGLAAHCLAADPRFVRISEAPGAVNDYRLQPDSPARGRGVSIPSEWPDPLKPKVGQPDLGALPYGSESLRVGRNARIIAGMNHEP